MGKPDVDSIEGLSPAISIEQKTTSRNPRSTVGTVTEIHDYMRLLWARAGVPYSPATGLPIEAQTVSQMVDRVMAMTEGTRLLLLAPVVRDRKGEYRKELAELQRRGFTRVKVDGTLYEIADVPALNRKTQARRSRRWSTASWCAPAPSSAWRTASKPRSAWSDGIVYAEDADTARRAPCSPRASPARSAASPSRTSSPGCSASTARTAPARPATAWASRPSSIPRWWSRTSARSLAEGAIAPWTGAMSPYYDQTLQSLARHFKVTTRTPWAELPEPCAMPSCTAPETPIEMTYKDGVRAYSVTKPFEGVLKNLQRRWRETDSAWVREEMSRYQAEKPCAVCHGARLKPEALAVEVAGSNIAEASDLSIRRALDWFRAVERR